MAADARWRAASKDLILILPLIAGPDVRDPAIAPVPWADPDKVEVSNLRVAFYRDNGVAETTQETREIVASCARYMEEAGRLRCCAPRRSGRPPSKTKAAVEAAPSNTSVPVEEPQAHLGQNTASKVRRH